MSTTTDTKPAAVAESIDVNVPLSTAYNQWTQFEEFPKFMAGVKKITQINDTLTHWEVKVAGSHHEFDAEITEQLPDEKVAWAALDEEWPHKGEVTFEAVSPDVTRVTVRMEWHPEGMKEKLGAALSLDDSQVATDLKQFKKFIEGKGSETGAWRGAVV